MKNKLKKIFVKATNNLLEEIYPSNYVCYCCNDELNSSSLNNLCSSCLSKIKYIKHPCEKCGEDLNDFTTFCKNCKDKVRHFDKVISVAVYEGVAKNLIYKLKYSNERFIANSISAFMLSKIKSSEISNKIDLIIPVPLSEERLKSRGFNQAQLLSNNLANELKIEHKPEVIKRIKSTPTQTHLNKQERLENLLNAFVVVDKESIKGKTILVVDDIITTGATLDEIARVLKIKGASEVYGLTFCHTKLENI